MNNDMSVLRELQIVELKILKEVVRMCEKHSLEYFAIDGTLLGAVRHGGFIPWDDDVDIGLPRDSFERFVELAPKELPSSMSINYFKYHEDDDKELSYGVRVYCNDLKIIQHVTENSQPHDVNIDIMQLDGMPKGKLKNKLHQYHLLGLKALAKMTQPETIGTHLQNRPAIDRVLIFLAKHCNPFRKMNTKKMYLRLDRCLKKYDVRTSGQVVIFISDYRFREMFSRDCYFPFRELPFEDMVIRCPAQSEKVLEGLYGNFMEYPPESARKSRHRVEIIRD